MKRLIVNLVIILIYSMAVYVLLIPCKIFIPAISISLICGTFLGFINEIIKQLRKLNGEKFSNLDEETKNNGTN